MSKIYHNELLDVQPKLQLIIWSRSFFSTVVSSVSHAISNSIFMGLSEKSLMCQTPFSRIEMYNDNLSLITQCIRCMFSVKVSNWVTLEWFIQKPCCMVLNLDIIAVQVVHNMLKLYVEATQLQHLLKSSKNLSTENLNSFKLNSKIYSCYEALLCKTLGDNANPIRIA